MNIEATDFIFVLVDKDFISASNVLYLKLEFNAEVKTVGKEMFIKIREDLFMKMQDFLYPYHKDFLDLNQRVTGYHYVGVMVDDPRIF